MTTPPHSPSPGANTALPRLRRRRRWRHVMVWAGLLVFTLGSYLGIYRWNFRPAVQRGPSAFYAREEVCLFFAPAAWLDYLLAERRTQRYVAGLWRLDLPSPAASGGQSADPFTPYPQSSPPPPSDSPRATESPAGWLYLEWTGEESPHGNSIARAILELPGQSPRAASAPPVIHRLESTGPRPFLFSRLGIVEELVFFQMQGLSPDFPGYLAFVSLDEDPDWQIPDKPKDGHSTDPTHPQEWHLELWPRNTRQKSHSLPGHPETSPRDRLTVLVAGELIALKHIPQEKESPTRTTYSPDRKLQWRLVFTRFPDDDPDKATILQQIDALKAAQTLTDNRD